MKVLTLHAHFDDFEFVAGGTYELLRRRLGTDFQGKVIICTDGKAGHHFRSREETGRLRLLEQEASAKTGGYAFEPLRLPNGEIPREACLRVTVELLAAMWKAIRDFEPDYLICPPVAMNPLAGVHVDHVAVAEAVRQVAYMINVPHAFTPEYPAADSATPKPCKVPVILNAYDGYMFGTNRHDIAINVEEAFDVVAQETWCHQTQVAEWLPWVGRHHMPVPKSLEDWKKILRVRFQRNNRELGIVSPDAHEAFIVTAWGQIPAPGQLEKDFPEISPCNEALEARLRHWRGEIP